MPEIDITPIEFLSPFGLVKPKVIAYMTWPSDDYARLVYLTNSVREHAKSIAILNNTGLTLEMDFLKFQDSLNIQDITPMQLLQNAMPIVVSGSSKASKAPQISAGQIAGQVLIEAIYLATNGESNVGVKMCLDRISERLTQKTPINKRVKNARPQDLRVHWLQYRSVSHLWAAIIGLRNIQQAEPKIEDVIRKSEEIRAIGEVIGHRNARCRFLPSGEAWHVSKDVLDFLQRT